MFPWLALAHAATPEAAIEAVLDGLHRAASEADAPGYFRRFTDDAVFIGTDASERWTLTEFRAWAAPRFEQASAWTYTPVERHVTVGPRGRTAWFDETLDHARYGRVRGSGALVREGREWKVAHYVLSFAVPNEVAGYAVRVIAGEAALPTPFTAAQIRDVMPVGAVYHHELRTSDEPLRRTSWEVVAADEGGCTIRYAEGEEHDDQTHTWTELRDHARFPAAHTTVSDERIDTALGPLDCRRYTVAADPSVTQHLWFCPDVPGAPVRVHVVRDGAIERRFELVERRLP